MIQVGSFIFIRDRFDDIEEVEVVLLGSLRTCGDSMPNCFEQKCIFQHLGLSHFTYGVARIRYEESTMLRALVDVETDYLSNLEVSRWFKRSSRSRFLLPQISRMIQSYSELRKQFPNSELAF